VRDCFRDYLAFNASIFFSKRPLSEYFNIVKEDHTHCRVHTIIT